MIAQTSNRITIDKDIQLLPLHDSIFVHVSWEESADYGRFSSNGMIIIKNGRALMIDTPMNDEKTEKLATYLKDSMFVTLQTLIIGHFHNDCLGGLGYLKKAGIESIANSLTVEKCKELDLPIPSLAFSDSLRLDFNGVQIECMYFGAGHTVDNITVWIPEKKILFGGCLIKSIQSRGLGNLTDSKVSEWDTSVEELIKKYKDIQIVIPGHGEIGDKELLTHTVELVKREKGI